jgi:hypothetical protein
MRFVLNELGFGLLYAAPVALLTLAACGGGGGSNGGATIIESFLGGTTSGLTSNGLVLRNNGGDDLAVQGAASGVAGFTFSQKVAEGATYNVTVGAQPSSPDRQSCAVTAGASGVMPASNIANIAVNCMNVFGLRVDVLNLTTQGLVLQNDYFLSSEGYALPHSDVLAVTSGNPFQTRTFEFGNLLPISATYDVSVYAQPTGQSCSFHTASAVSAVSVSGVISTDTAVQLNCG